MESIKNATAVVIDEETQVAVARRAAADLCRRLELSDATIARAELIAVELTGNMLHHAGRGRLYCVPAAVGCGMHLIATDSGPGTANVERAMTDGFSTHTTPGLGLGAVLRQAGSLDLYSRPGAGMVASTLLCDQAMEGAADTAVLSRPLPGEQVNGDSWAIHHLPNRTIYFLVDGLGHGHFASQAAAAAVDVLHAALAQDPTMPLNALIHRMHGPMQATRGAAVLLATVHAGPAGRVPEVLCCGVGNISAVLCAPNGSTHALVSHNGTVGHRMSRVQEFSYNALPGTLLVMHSDGLSTRWKPAQYPGLLQHTPATVAGVLFRDTVRERDDATILVARITSSHAAEGQ